MDGILQKDCSCLYPILKPHILRQVQMAKGKEKWDVEQLGVFLKSSFGHRNGDINFEAQKIWMKWEMDTTKQIGTTLLEFERLANRANRAMEDKAKVEHWLSTIPDFFRVSIQEELKRNPYPDAIITWKHMQKISRDRFES